MTVSTSPKVKDPTLGDIMCLAHVDCVKKKKKTESICARDCLCT